MERVVVRKSNSALYLLFAEGCCFLLISVAVLACGFVLNFHDDFDYDEVTTKQDYTQYWVGLVLFITAFLAIAAGTRQRSRWLVLSAISLFLVTILVSLFALVAEGNDWIQHKNAVRRKGFWESEDYGCTSPTSTSCHCTKANADPKTISGNVDCDTLERLDYIYGGLICCILAGVFLALSSIVIVVIFIPIRPFTVPVPKKRIRKITVLEEKEPKPVVVYKPQQKEPKPEVQEIVLRERQPQRMRVIEPRPVRERPPQRIRTVVHNEPRQQKEIVYRRPQRQRTLVYDEPRPDGPMRTQTLVPVELPPERREGEVYDVGRFVDKVHPTPGQSAAPRIEEGFVVNPNYKPPTPVQPAEPAPVHYGREELEPPVRYVRQEPAPVRYIRREEPSQVHYVRKPTIVYEQRPRITEERALVPVRRSVAQPGRRVVVHSGRPRPSYIVQRPRQRPLIAVRRRRANSDEGPRMLRARQARAQPRRIHTAQPARHRPTGGSSRMLWQRVRSNSDEGPRLYREPLQQERPARIYTDKEITMAGAKAQGGGAKPRVFTGDNIGTANLGTKPTTAHMAQARNEDYDRALEAQLPSADQWAGRPTTPY